MKIKLIREYCNEISGKFIQERIKKLDIPCSNTMKFYGGTSYIDFGEFERIIKSDIDLGYDVFAVDTFSKIKCDRKYNANDYNNTYEVMEKYYELIDFDTEFNLDVTSRLFESKNQRCIR